MNAITVGERVSVHLVGSVHSDVSRWVGDVTAVDRVGIRFHVECVYTFTSGQITDWGGAERFIPWHQVAGVALGFEEE
jgi:hypothetical protein